MRLLNAIFLRVLTVLCVCERSVATVPDLRNVVAPTNVQEKAVRELIIRTIGEDASRSFAVHVDNTMPLKSFNIEKTSPTTITLKGSDGVSVAKGFHHYLKYYLHKHIEWTNTRVVLESPLQLPNVSIFSKSASDFIYYQNVCTWSYSFAWWNFATWRRHIDWMAMMGVSLTIAPIQEYIWNEVYVSLGLTKSEIDEHFAGAAFQAWQRMGNMHGWGGPITPTYRRLQKVLQQRILKAERDLGMRVALPAFAGHLPVAMTRIFPNTTFTPVDRWNRFPDRYCCTVFLDPTEPLFQEIAVKFLKLTIEIYGSDNIYFCDPYNEVSPRERTVDYLRATSYHIYESMRSVDNSAIWMLQDWLFQRLDLWTRELTKAFLTGVPVGKLLVLDLQSEEFPQYEQTHFFYGQPFIWCMLHNFGGTLGMHGSVDIVNTRIRTARNMVNTTMVGVGTTPEGINQNYAMYELVLERGWAQDDFNVSAWFDTYADVRYGVRDERLRKVWQLLRESVFSYSGFVKIRGRYPITKRPSPNLYPWTWYNTTIVYEAWKLFLTALEDTKIPEPNLQFSTHDVVDLTRQFIQQTFDKLYVNLMAAYRDKQMERFVYIAERLLEILNDLEAILSTNMDFSISPWLESARSLGRTPAEKQLFEMNARNQITSWGPTGQIHDYATKQWSGIVIDYYRPRWELFLQMLLRSLQRNEKFDENEFNQRVSREIENPFSILRKVYPSEPVGDSFTIAKYIYNKWTAYQESLRYKEYCAVPVSTDYVNK
ncbi:alpha-N-acetylglucosaminidase [Ceratitis capitata]|uniref:(Mediterranean fruit fly) hypothetical protein n=1 Tax=Ceratitis capitata TaxID=7213 RepID=A0A811UI28_CERCA|nr:alpha-N-acetylglucosaminidase [Ceratitis capitata]CAD6996843.1 unnamed protein product [Ceratitis capitata]